MAQQDAVIRLLLVEDKLEDAEQLISQLRNGGMAIRPQQPESAEDLARILGSADLQAYLAQRAAQTATRAAEARAGFAALAPLLKALEKS